MSINIVSISLFLLTGTCLWLAARLLFHRSWLLGWLRGSAGLLIFATAVACGLLAIDMRAYQPAGKGNVIATVSILGKSGEGYPVVVTSAAGKQHQTRVRGDLWQLEIRAIKLSGMAELYRIETINGRYYDLNAEFDATHEPGNLLPSMPVWGDSWFLLSQLPYLQAGVIRSRFVPLVKGGLYSLVDRQGNIEARPINKASQSARRK
jgi:hypothetical protein